MDYIMNATLLEACRDTTASQVQSIVEFLFPFSTSLMMLLQATLWAAMFSTGLVALPVEKPILDEGFLPLRFKDDGTFQIAVMNDLHTGEAEDLWWGPAQDVNTVRVMNTVFDNESPQLVVLNGDLITGEGTMRENSTHYFDLIAKPMVERGLPWASTYGNHDSMFNLSREALFARENLWPNSLTGNMVPLSSAGITNYYLPVYSSDPDDLVPEVILWFFDSRGGGLYQQKDSSGKGINQPGWVDQTVVEWMKSTSTLLQTTYGKIIPSYAFYHIPIYAMNVYQTKVGVDPHKEPGINDDYPLAPQGVVKDKYTGGDVPFEEALLSIPDLIATFSGHDHGNDWCFQWDKKLPTMSFAGNGVHICFGRHTGYGGYGNWMRGSRQILLNKKTLGKETETWTRLEDSTESGRVVLNSTYGVDEYPAVENKRTTLPRRKNTSNRIK